MAEAGSLVLFGFPKTLGMPLTMNVPVRGRAPSSTARDCSSKLVAQPNPLLMEKG